MKDRFARIDCFVLAGGAQNPKEDFEKKGDLTRLERGYRRYAALFEKVTLVLKKEQAVERYLNYPHVCDSESEQNALVGVRTALETAETDTVFIGHSSVGEFPLELAVDLVRKYDGEIFLGYFDESKPEEKRPLFGVFSRKLKDRLAGIKAGPDGLARLLKSEGTFLPFPAGQTAKSLGLARS